LNALEGTAYVAGTLAALAYVGHFVSAMVPVPIVPHEQLTNTANSSAEQANLVVTNTRSSPVIVCVKGIVSQKKNGLKAETIPVCSGEIKPHSTMTISAPYKVGQVKDICSDDSNRFGKILDWDLCNFNMADVSDFK
jgi:translation elongation factor EF-1alpha